MQTSAVLDALCERIGVTRTGPPRAVGGGDISAAYRLPSRDGPLFVKLGGLGAAAMFAAEADGLRALAAADGIAVPAVIDHGEAGGQAYLALEWLELRGHTAEAGRRLGIGLARQHRSVGRAFGWHRDNWIGPNVQHNAQAGDWAAFYRERRLAPQLAMARRNGLPAAALAAGEQLLAGLERLLARHEPAVSLLHGDLWSGNWGASAAGRPYVFDPAVYYGDREADLAMTRLFGGFGETFYAGYEQAWPLPSGWRARVDLYNAYHLLNHFNLFGTGYAPQTSAVLTSLAGRL